MKAQKDMSASEHHYKIKVWEKGNESNFYEETLKVKNEMGQMTVPQDSQVLIKTGTSEPPKPKEEEKKETCGIQYRNSITCVRYGKQYGPLYSGSVSITSYKGWDKLLLDNRLSKEEKDIICGMSVNEGNLDAVQSYDSELITMGAMQKTTKTTGNGELSTQIGEFKEEFKEKYKELFENCGWDFKKENNKWKAYYKTITRDTLKSKIRSGFEEKNNKKKVICVPLEPLINAGKDEDFQTKQINDFIDRLRKCLDEKPVKKYHKNKEGLRIPDEEYSFKAKEVMKSKLGRALVLDQSVNRPSLTRFNLGDSLNRFFINNPKVSKNPSDWKENHSKYETEIIVDYGKKREGTDMLLRYNNINTNPILK